MKPFLQNFQEWNRDSYTRTCLKNSGTNRKTRVQWTHDYASLRNQRQWLELDGPGNPLAFLLSPGNDHDSRHAIPLLGTIDITGSNILGDKAYGTKAIRDYIADKEAKYTIPPKSNDPHPWQWTISLTRSGTWFNASFRKSNGLDESFHAITSWMRPFLHLFTLPRVWSCSNKGDYQFF